MTTEDPLTAVKQLASKSGIKITGSFQSDGRKRCLDCEELLPAGVWYSEDVSYHGEPMIKYWIGQQKGFKCIAFSWPSGERKLLCSLCYDVRDDARVNQTASRAAALQAATVSGIKLDENGDAQFPGQSKRVCLYCDQTLTKKGWHYSSMKTKNGIDVYVCHEVKMGALMPLAYKVKNADEFICRNCYQACDGSIDV